LRNEELCNLKTGKGGEQTSMGSWNDRLGEGLTPDLGDP
jgi:hypothetical protein